MVNMNPLYQVFQNTSCHAGNWLDYTKSPVMKAMIMVLLVPFHCALLYFFINTIFIEPNVETSTTLNWQPDNQLVGPKITVCNPRMFDKSKVEALNISSELLSYIFLAYDYGNDLSYWPNFHSRINELESEYRIKTQNISNIGKHLAINCKDFIGYNLCEYFFDPDPWISYFGACFTSRKKWYVKGSGGLHHKIIKLNTSPDYTAGKVELYTFLSLEIFFHVL